MNATLRIDVDDTPVTAELRKVGGGNYVTWHMTFWAGASEISFDASDPHDIENIIDQLQHDLMLLKSGAARTTDGRVA